MRRGRIRAAVAAVLVIAVASAVPWLRPTEYGFFEPIPYGPYVGGPVDGEWELLYDGPAYAWCREKAGCLLVPTGSANLETVDADMAEAGWEGPRDATIYVYRRQRWRWEPDRAGILMPYCPNETPRPWLAPRCFGAGPIPAG
jgi:hypothetical protein